MRWVGSGREGEKHSSSKPSKERELSSMAFCTPFLTTVWRTSGEDTMRAFTVMVTFPSEYLEPFTESTVMLRSTALIFTALLSEESMTLAWAMSSGWN